MSYLLGDLLLKQMTASIGLVCFETIQINIVNGSLKKRQPEKLIVSFEYNCSEF